jgi:hypothetical protein
VNETSSESTVIVRADEFNCSASNRIMQELNRGTLHDSLTGVVNVSETLKISTGTWEVHKFLQGRSMKAERWKEGLMDDGVRCSSEEASNDRGAKGWQRVIANKRNLCPYTQHAVNKRQRNLNA